MCKNMIQDQEQKTKVKNLLLSNSKTYQSQDSLCIEDYFEELNWKIFKEINIIDEVLHVITSSLPDLFEFK